MTGAMKNPKEQVLIDEIEGIKELSHELEGWLYELDGELIRKKAELVRVRMRPIVVGS